MTTQKEVALRAGVSSATVSRVVNGLPHVKPDITEAVIRAIAELNYQPNYSAKALRTLRTRKLLLTASNISNTYFGAIIRAAQLRAQSLGYGLVLGNSGDNGELEDVYASLLLGREVDGLIILGHHLPDALREFAGDGDHAVPIVCGCERSDAPQVSSVSIDHEAASREAMDYLYSQGHTRIVILSGEPSAPVARERLRGVRASAAAHGRPDSAFVIVGDYSARSGHEATAAMLRLLPRPTAIFAFSDDMAIGAMHAVAEAGLTCPGDVSIIGFDDVPTVQYLNPPLTSVHQPMEAIGVQSVDILVDILDGKLVRPRNVTVLHRLVVRRTTRAVETAL